MTSSTQNGAMYTKVFEGEFVPMMNFGFFHANLKAVPYPVIHDDIAPVEKNCWGIPYKVE